MKAVILQKTGGPNILKPDEVAAPVPAEGEVLVRNKFIGINYAEILSRRGLYGWSPKRPYILGMESSGVIEKVGQGVDNNRIGQKVMVGAKYGTYAEYVTVPEIQAIPVIDKYSMEENAAFLVNFMTSWVSLFKLAKVKAGESVLITAAAGGVGTAAVKLSVGSGCIVYGLAGSDYKTEYLKRLGVKGAFNYKDKEWPKQLAADTKGVDVVLEVVGGDINKICFQLLKPFGRMVAAGFASLDLNKWNPYSIYKTYKDFPRFHIGDLAEKSVAVMSSHIGILLDKYPDLLMEEYDKLSSFVIEHDIHPVVDKVFPFDDVALAHEYIESRKSIGKVLLKI